MTPYDQGYKAFEDGTDWSENPFGRWEEPSEYDDWRNGWNLADAWYNGQRDE